jgi:ABC-2 type transport system permease protein
MWGFFQRDLIAEWRGRGSILFQLANIGLTVAAYLFLGRLVERQTLAQWAPRAEGYFPFVLVGMAVNGTMLTALTGLSRSLQQQKATGLLKPLFLSQTRPERVLMLSSLYPAARAAVDLACYFTAGLVFGSFSLARANPVSAVVVSGLAIGAFASLGLWAAACTVLFRYGNPLLWVVSGSSWLLGGVLYPTVVLPAPLRRLAELFPITHATAALRGALLGGDSLADLAVPSLFLAAFILVMAPLGVALFQVGLKRARMHGTLAEA